jgi:hypothetical protein
MSVWGVYEGAGVAAGRVIDGEWWAGGKAAASRRTPKVGVVARGDSGLRDGLSTRAWRRAEIRGCAMGGRRERGFACSCTSRFRARAGAVAQALVPVCEPLSVGRRLSDLDPRLAVLLLVGPTSPVARALFGSAVACHRFGCWARNSPATRGREWIPTANPRGVFEFGRSDSRRALTAWNGRRMTAGAAGYPTASHGGCATAGRRRWFGGRPCAGCRRRRRAGR